MLKFRVLTSIFLTFICMNLHADEDSANLDDRSQAMIAHIDTSITNALNQQSRLTPEIYQIDGMSSRKVRDFLNNLCSMPNTNYLEIGCWKGSTLVSALYGNESTVVEAVAIDNWSQFGAPAADFHYNCNKFLSNINLRYYSDDCFNLKSTTVFNNPFNIYFYDGLHTEQAQEQALTYYDKALDDLFILIVDDWNWIEVRNGTLSAIKKLNYEVVYFRELPADFPGDRAKWWNGIYVAVIHKPSNN